jgi:hypothetical protein
MIPIAYNRFDIMHVFSGLENIPGFLQLCARNNKPLQSPVPYKLPTEDETLKRVIEKVQILAFISRAFTMHAGSNAALCPVTPDFKSAGAVAALGPVVRHSLFLLKAGRIKKRQDFPPLNKFRLSMGINLQKGSYHQAPS